MESPSNTQPETSRVVHPPKAIVFDLDGTLVDTRDDIAAACNYALSSLGRAELPIATIAGFVGDGARKLLSRALGAGVSEAEIDEAFATFGRYYADHAADRTTWMPGAEQALAALSHLPLALATNKPREATLALLDALGATSRFAGIVCGGDGPLKPSPEPILSALAPSGVSPKDAWVVGDGVQDILAGRAAGATSIAVLGGFTPDAVLRVAGADAVLGTLLELLPLIAEVEASLSTSSSGAGPRSP